MYAQFLSARAEQETYLKTFTMLATPAQQSYSTAEALSQGDLTVMVTPRSAGDVLGHAFAVMIANLRQLIRQVKQSANEEQAASLQEVSASAATLSQMAHHLQELVEQFRLEEEEEPVKSPAPRRERASRLAA